MQRGAVRALRDDPDADEPIADPVEAPLRHDGAVERDGFNVHASVAIAADDDVGRERLLRYGARPPLALDRLRRLPGDRIAYRIKNLRDGRAKHRVMNPLEFLARLAALVPPPRYPLLRFHGVLGPRSPWRREVVPRPPETTKPCPPSPPPSAKDNKSRATQAQPSHSDRPRTASSISQSSISAEDRERMAATASSGPGIAQPAASAASAPTLTQPPLASGALQLTPNVVSVSHWTRLLNGRLYAATPRLDWRTLLQRSFEIDVFECPSCHGRLRVLGSVTEPDRVRSVLQALHMPTAAPRAARARDPTELFGDLPSD
jgi:putative transposase